MTTMWLFIYAASALLPLAASTGVNFRGSGVVSKNAASEVLQRDIVDADHHVAKFEDALRQMFTSLPKNSHGNLAHNTVRYALHRFFVDRHGWFIGGLEPTAAALGTDLPSFLQEAFERKVGTQGLDLHGLAVLAATLGDLAEKEVRARLEDMYKIDGLSPSMALKQDQAHEVLHAFLVSFFVSNQWEASSKEDLLRKMHTFDTKYRDFNNTMAWYYPIRDKHVTGEEVTFDTVAQVASEMSQSYHAYNDETCKSMRTVLRDAESRRPGRVRLSSFYNMSLHGHWDFTEKVEFLRALGLLDETDPKQTSIIIANYAVSKINCLNVTNMYSICCRNVCDDLTSSVEKEIGAPTATPERIVAVVAKLPSESVAAPRDLSGALWTRLSEVAAHHGGEVPVHGRLFAQWMHHAFPLECPYPQEAGTVLAQTSEEWLAQTGASTQEASLEEMTKHVEADTCAISWEGKVECGEEVTDLPWSMTEELLAHPGAVDEVPVASSPGHLILAGTLLVAALVLARPLLSRPAGAGARRDTVILVAVLLASAAFLADLLDSTVFFLALLGSCSLAVAKLAAARVAGDSGSLPFRQVKKV